MPQILSDEDVGLSKPALEQGATPKLWSDAAVGLAQTKADAEPSSLNTKELLDEADRLDFQIAHSPSPSQEDFARRSAIQAEYQTRKDKPGLLKFIATRAIPQGIGKGASFFGKGAEALIGQAVGTGDTEEDVEKSMALGEPLPVEKSAAALPAVPRFFSQIGLGMVGAAPKIAAIAALPESLPLHMAAAGGLFGLDETGKFHPKDAAVMALFPLVGAAGSRVASMAIGRGLESGSIPIANRLGQKLVDAVGQQFAYDAYLTLADSPQLIEEYRQDPKRAVSHIADIVGQNLAWSLLGIRDYRGKIPSAAEHFIFEHSDRYAKAADKLFGHRIDELTIPDIEQQRAARQEFFDAIKAKQSDNSDAFNEAIKKFYGEQEPTAPPSEEPPPLPPTPPPAPPAPPAPPISPAQPSTTGETYATGNRPISEHIGTPPGAVLPPQPPQVRQEESGPDRGGGGPERGEAQQGQAPEAANVVPIERPPGVNPNATEWIVSSAVQGVNLPSREDPNRLQFYPSKDGGVVEYGANHPEVLNRLGVPGFESRESRNTPAFGYRTNLRPFVPRDVGAQVARDAGQLLEEPDTDASGNPAVHSDQVQHPEQPGVALGEAEIVVQQAPMPERFSSLQELLDFRSKRQAEEVELYEKTIGLSHDEAVRLQDILRRDGSTEKFSKKLSAEKQARLEWFFEESPYNKKGGPFEFWDFDKRYDPEELLHETDKDQLALSAIHAITAGEVPNETGDRTVFAAVALGKLKENGGTWSDIARALDGYTTRNSSSQADKTEFFKTLGLRIRTFAQRQGIDFPQGDLQRGFGAPETPLTLPAKSGTVEPVEPSAAPATITAQEQGEKAPEMAAESGEIPVLSAAELRTRIDKLNTDAQRAESKAKQLRKINADQQAKRYERQAQRIRQQLEILRGNLSVLEAEAPKKPVSVARGIAGLTRFNRETERSGNDILSWLHENAKLLSRSAAQKMHGKDWWSENKSQWEDAPSKLSAPHHNVIYSQKGSTPNQVAQWAFEANQISEPHERELWAAIASASKNRLEKAEREKSDVESFKQEQARHEDFLEAAKKGNLEVNAGGITTQTKLWIDGEVFTVKAIDPDTDEVVLEDGRRFGEQRLSANQVIYVERFEEGGAGEDFPAAEEPPVAAPAPKPAARPAGGELFSAEEIPFNLTGETGRGAAAPPKPAAPPEEPGLFGEPPKPAEPAAPVVPEPPKIQERPLTKAEQKEFHALTLKDRAAREQGGEKLTTEETKRYEYLTALAGQQSFGLEEPTGKEAIRGRIRVLEKEIADLESQPSSGKGSKARAERLRAATSELRNLQDDLTEGEGEMVLDPPPSENPNSGVMEKQQFRVRQLTSQEYLQRFPDVQWRMREFPNFYEPWIAESRRIYYTDDGKQVTSRDNWYEDGIGKTKQEAMEKAGSYDGRTARRWKDLSTGGPKIDEDSIHNWDADYIQKQWRGRLSPEQQADVQSAFIQHHQRGVSARDLAAQLNRKWSGEPEPKAPEAPPTPEVPAKPAKFGGATPDGTTFKGFTKIDGRWHRLDAEGKPGKIPVNDKIHQQLERDIALPPVPADTRTPFEILSQAAQVRVKAPEGATFIRITDENGKKAVFNLGEINGSENLARGVNVTKIEAGTGPREKFKPMPGEVTVEDVGRKRQAAVGLPTGQTVVPLKKNLRFASADELRTAVNDPKLPIPDDMRKGLHWLLSQPFVKQVPGLQYEIADYIQAGAVGEYLPVKSIVRFIQFGEAYVPIHEFFHHLHRFLQLDDRAFIRDLRKQTILAEIEKTKDISEQQFLRSLYEDPLASDEYIAKDGPDKFYHLTNQFEFFTWLMTERAMTELNRPEARTFVQKVRGVIQQLMNWVRDNFGIRAKYEDALWRQILSGKYEYRIQDGVRFDPEASKRNLSLALNPDDWTLKRFFQEIGYQAATIGGYMHRYMRQVAKADELGILQESRARALDGMLKARDMTNLALDEGGRTNYYDAVTNAGSLGEKNEVIRSAFESATRYQTEGIRLRNKLAEKKAEIDSEKFRNDISRASEKADRADLLSRAKQTFVNQIAASAGRITQTLNTLRVVGGMHEQLQSDLKRLQALPNFSDAVAQHFERIVNTLATDDRGISLLAAGGNKSGQDIWDDYLRRSLGAGQPMPTGDQFALGELASSVLAANRDLRNQFTSLALIARDIVSSVEVNEAGARLARQLSENPAQAVQRIIKRAASLSDKSARAEAVWLALNRPIQRKLKDFNDYSDAVRLHEAVEADPEYRRWVNDVNRDSQGLYIPNEVRQKLAAPDSPTREPFFEFAGKQTMYGPDGQTHEIDLGWTPETVAVAQNELAKYKGEIQDWLDNPENQDSPSRQYWENRQTQIENTLMSSAIWNPSAMVPLHVGKLGLGSWGMPETFYQGLALPQAKLAFIAQKNFDRLWTQGKGWYGKHHDLSESDIRRAYQSHGKDELTRKDYQRSILNAVAWEFRNGHDVRVGDVINGHEITKSDLDLLHSEARQLNELYDLMWQAGNLSGAENVMELPRIVDEFSSGSWGIRRAMEIGLHKGTTLPRTFSKHGENLARIIHKAIEDRQRGERDLAEYALTHTPEETQAQRQGIHDDYYKALTNALNDTDRFQNFLLGFMRQRAATWVKQSGLSPFEDHYRQMTDMVTRKDPNAPMIVDEILDFLNANTDNEWTPQAIRDQFFGEITKLTERFYKLTAENGNSNVTVKTDKRDTAFNRAWTDDVGPAYFYDYGWIDAGEMRRYATDMASFSFDRMMSSMKALKAQIADAISEMTGSMPQWKQEQVRVATEAFREGKDFRDLQHLEQKALELDRMLNGVGKWMGNEAVYAEGINLRMGSRVLSDAISAALTGIRTAARISGVSMGGSAWKMGNVFQQLGYGKLRSHPTAALSAIISLARMGAATTFGWYSPERGFVPGVPMRMAMNVPGAIKAAAEAKGAERFYSGLEAALRDVTDEQFAALSWWFDQKQLGMTPDTAIGARVANMIAASRTKGGVLTRGQSYPSTTLGKTWQAGKLAISKPWAIGEAFLAGTNVYLPGAFGYNITYDAVGRQASWYIDMLATNARKTFETYEKLGQLGRFNFTNLRDPRNKLLPWEVLPSLAGRISFSLPSKLPAWLRPNSTNLHFARELLSTSTDVDLQDLLLRYWKRLSETPSDQRGAVQFLAPEEQDATAAMTRAEGRARGIISRFVEQTHHAAPSNRPYQLQKASAMQSIMPFMGWSAQTIKQLNTYFGRAAFSAESRGQTPDTYTGMLIAAGLTAIGMGLYAFVGGDLETRFLRLLDRTLHHKETTTKTIDEADTVGEKLEIAMHNMTAGIPMLNSALNTVLGETGYRGQYGFQAFAFDKVNALLNYVRGVYRTHDLTYGLDRLAEANIPITETIIENTFQRQGFQNNRNAVRALQKLGPQDLVERRASASVSLPTELTPYRQALTEAIYSGKPELVTEAYNAFVNKAAQLGRPDPEKIAAQVFSTLNPYRQAFGGLLTEQQRTETLDKMADFDRNTVSKAETAYASAASQLGLSANFTKEESAETRQAAGRSTGGSLPGGVSGRRISLPGISTGASGSTALGLGGAIGGRRGISVGGYPIRRRTGQNRPRRLVSGRLRVRSTRLRMPTRRKRRLSYA